MKNFLRRILIPVMLLASFFLMPAFAQETEPEPIELPLSPEYLRWVERQKEKQVRAEEGIVESIEEEDYGYIPIPIDLSHLADNPPKEIYDSDFPIVQDTVLPSTYDLRIVNGKSYVPSVKDQQQYGACWAFASTGAMESNWLMKGKADRDLSEMHLAWFAFKNSDKSKAFFNKTGTTLEDVLGGGNSFYTTALYSRLDGPVMESELKYPARSDNQDLFIPQKANPQDYTRTLRLRDVYYLSHVSGQNVNADNEARQNVKRRIMENGAVYMSFYSDTGAYNDTSSGVKSFFDNTHGTDTNHAVQIVGWDDNYSKSNFTTQPNMDGAWLVKNSWGTSWGEGGYFWMSYEQYIYGGTSFIVEEANTDMKAYYYDALGWTGNVSFSGSNVYGANVFKSERDNEAITEVGFYTYDNNLDYEITIYTNLGTTMPENSPTEGTEYSVGSGTIPFAGYHTVTLDSPVALTKGQYFSVVVKITGTGSFPIETKGSSGSYSENVVIEDGSFVSSNGSYWSNEKGSYNVCIKAFTVSTTNTSAPTIDASSLPDGKTGTSYSATLSATGTTPITWSVSNGSLPDGLTLDGSTGVISGTPTTEGTYTFTIRAKNSSGSDEKTFTLKISLVPQIVAKDFRCYTGDNVDWKLELSPSASATWTAKGLPTGLTLGASSGHIYGTPTTIGTYNVNITAVTEAGESTATITIMIIQKPEAPTISTAELPNGTIGTEYSYTIQATGATPITFAATGLPDGLTINTSTGTITGTPTTANTYSITITASNPLTAIDGTAAQKTFNLQIKDKPPVISHDTLAPAAIGKSYSAQLFTSSGTGSISWTASGLPKGMSLNSEGTLSGTPKGSAKTYNINIAASNSGGSDTATFSLSVMTAPQMSTKKLAVTTTGKKYTAKLAAKGSLPVNWSVTGLPKGYDFNVQKQGATAAITGTTEKPGTYNIKITVSNDSGYYDEKTFELVVNGVAPKITAALAKAKVGEAYNGSKLAFTGTKPMNITYSIMEKDKTKFRVNTIEELGLALSVDTASGTAEIIGTPEKSIKSLPIVITADNGFGKTPTTKKLALTITGEKPVFTSPDEKAITVIQEKGTAIKDITFTVTGTQNMTFTMSKAAGFTLTSTGNTATLSGTAPNKDGKTNITITAENSEGKATKKVMIQAMTPPAITTQSLKAGTQNKTYSDKVTATGTSKIEWSCDGTLPSGMKFNNGAFSGKPVETGSFKVKLTASNALGTASNEFTIMIASASEAKALPTVLDYESVPEDDAAIATVGTVPVYEPVPDISFGAERAPESLGKLADGWIVAAVLPEVSVTESGMYDLNVTLDESIETGAELHWLAFPQNSEGSEDDTIAEFYDLDGEEILTVPDSHEVVVSVWLNEGVIYAPVIAVSSAK